MLVSFTFSIDITVLSVHLLVLLFTFPSIDVIVHFVPCFIYHNTVIDTLILPAIG